MNSQYYWTWNELLLKLLEHRIQIKVRFEIILVNSCITNQCWFLLFDRQVKIQVWFESTKTPTSESYLNQNCSPTTKSHLFFTKSSFNTMNMPFIQWNGDQIIFFWLFLLKYQHQNKKQLFSRSALICTNIYGETPNF